ncbi:hypothetical protein RJ639_025416, partial [Escallonia herrerae]
MYNQPEQPNKLAGGLENDAVKKGGVDSIDGGIAGFDGAIDAGLTAAYDAADQLTVSFRGQVYVFDSVSTDKAQWVLFTLGGCELAPDLRNVDLSYQKGMDKVNPGRYTVSQRAACLNRFRQKRSMRCFEKKITYKVRQEVALRH